MVAASADVLAHMVGMADGLAKARDRSCRRAPLIVVDFERLEIQVAHTLRQASVYSLLACCTLSTLTSPVSSQNAHRTKRTYSCRPSATRQSCRTTETAHIARGGEGVPLCHTTTCNEAITVASTGSWLWSRLTTRYEGT